MGIPGLRYAFQEKRFEAYFNPGIFIQKLHITRSFLTSTVMTCRYVL